MSEIADTVAHGVTLTAGDAGGVAPFYPNPLTVTASGTIEAGSAIGVYGSAGYTAGWQVSNDGAIRSDGAAGVQFRSAGTVTNAGAVAGGAIGVNLLAGGTVANTGTASAIAGTSLYGILVSGGAGTVTNAGTIRGGNDGADLLAGGTVANTGTASAITGTSRYGIYVSGRAGTVTNAGTVAGGKNGVNLLAGGTVANTGTASAITGTTYEGIYVSGGAGTVINAGTVVGQDNGVELLGGGSVANTGTASAIVSTKSDGIAVSGGAGTVTNAGTITGGNDGVYLLTGGTITNTGTASAIMGTGTRTQTSPFSPQSGDGVSVSGGAGTVTNAGTVVGQSNGVELLKGGSITNTGTASSIRGTTRNGIAVQGGAGTVTNAGTIAGSTGVYLRNGGSIANIGTASAITASNRGIYLRGSVGTVTNAGTIAGSTGVDLDAGGSVANTGTASTITGRYGDGIYARGSAGTVANAGTVAGRYNGVELHNGGSITNTGTASAITNTGTRTHTSPLSSQSSGNGIYITGAVGRVINAGTIAGIEDGVYLVAGGSVTNIGSASAIKGMNGDGISVNGAAGSVSNNGTVVGFNHAVYMRHGGTVANTGTASIITATGHHGVYVTGGAGSVTNAGSIVGSVDGVVLQRGGTVANTGTASTITGATNMGVYVGGTVGTVINAGTITGGLDGVYMRAGGTVANTGTASIITGRGNHGVFVSGGAGAVTNAGTVVGSVDGVVLTAGGTVANTGAAGTITGATNMGVYVSGGAGTVTNAGTVAGSVDGVYLRAGGTVSNTGAAGTITGASNIGVYVSGGTGTVTNDGAITGSLDGVALMNGGTVANTGAAGTITGTTNIGVYVGGGAGTVTNAGTIFGAVAAIQFIGTYDDRLILDPGAVVRGAVIGQTGTGATNTLELAGLSDQAGTLSGFGAQFQNFGTIAVDADAAWTLGGTGETITAGVSLGSTLTVAASGTAAFAGALTGAGGLAIDGPSETDLLAASDFAGGVALGAGTLVLGNGAALGTGTLAMTEGTTLAFAGNVTVANGITLAGDPTFAVAAGQVETFSGPITDTAGGPAGVLEKTGAGILVLDGDGSYSGGTELDGGTLDLGTPTAAGTGPITFGAGSGATLQIEAAALGAGGMFGNTVAGFTGGEAIDLRGIGTATASFDYGTDVLTLSENGATVATLRLTGDYAGRAFLARADGAGGTDVTLDAAVQAPAVTARLADDTGSSSGDGITRDDNIAGTGDPGQTVVLREGGTVVGSALVGTDGTWSTTPAGLPQGLQTVTASEGYLGQTGTASVTLTYDTTAPAASSPTLTVAENAGATPIGIAAPSDNLTAADGLAIAAGSLPGDGTVTLADGTPVAAGESLTAAQLQGLAFTPTPGAYGQSSAFTYTVTDAAGNASTGTATLDVGPANVPSVSGLQPSTTNLQDAMRPFASATVTDPTAGATDSLAIALSGAAGTLAGAGLTANPDGTYALGPASPQALTREIEALIFTPAADGPVQATGFALTVTSSTGASATASTAYTVDSTPNQSLFGSTATSASSPQGEVYALYQGLLGRAPDPTGGEQAGADLEVGAPLDRLTQSLLVSQEGVSWFTPGSSDGDFVDQLYERVLGRTESTDEQAYWDRTLQQGASRADVADSFVFSPEHLGDIQPALSGGVFVADAASSEAARLYYGLLDRAPDADGLRNQTAALDGGASLDALAQSFLSSPEYAADNPTPPSDQAFVDALFANALGREPGQGGYWVQQLGSGAETRAQVAVGIAESPEAQQHLAGRIETGYHVA